jgi:hypothetical protein
MGRLIKTLFVLVVLGFLALTGYAYYPGNLVPEPAEVRLPVTLHAD